MSSFRLIALTFLTFLLFNCISSEFTATDMHKLNRIGSTIVTPDGQYLIFQTRQWDESSGKFYSHLQYTSATTAGSPVKDLTPRTLDQSDSSPVMSTEFPNTVLFLRSKESRTHIYSLTFDPTATTQADAVPITDYPLDVTNLSLTKNILVFSTDMYVDCENDMQCTADKDAEVAARGSNSYQVYTKLMSRHWDFWYTEGKMSHIFYQKLKLEGNNVIVDGEHVDLLAKQSIASPPIENGPEQFSISNEQNLIAFSTHAIDKKMAHNTKWDIVIADLQNNNELTTITTNEAGRCQNPQISADGKKVAYLCMKRYGLESDALHMRIYDVATKEVIMPTESSDTFKPQISSYTWLDHENNIFVLSVVDAGHSRLYRYDFTNGEYQVMTDDKNYYNAPTAVSATKILINHSSFKAPDVISFVDYNESTAPLWTVTDYVNLNADTLSKFEMMDADSFTFKSPNGIDDVQGWIMKPINFKEGVKYPLAFLIHGGPEGAWEPSWSYRWNPNLWANHGFAVVMINPHGSSGMGIEYQDAVRFDWGGLPFRDLMAGFDYVNATYGSWIDMDRVGGCGASYGGYMINWIQSNNDEGKFKCLVNHDGVFSTITMFYATEELWFPMSEYCPHDSWGCTPFESDEARLGFETFNPEYKVDNWKTPQLVIHGGLDFRIPITEGISTFTALQLKGVPSRFLHFPDENHWVIKPENSIKWYKEVLGWLDKYLEYN